MDRLRIALGRQAVDHRPAGIAQAEDGGDLVVGFADGVVDGAAEAGDVGPTVEVVKRGVPAGDDQADGGEGRVSGFGVRVSARIFFFTRNPRPETRNPIEDHAVQMRLDVIDGDERLGE